MRRVDNKWEVVARVLGHNIWIGAYEYRSKAIEAEQVANTIRAGLIRCQKSEETSKLIGKYRFKEAMTEMKNSMVREPGF